jgi:hypothetical protein
MIAAAARIGLVALTLVPASAGASVERPPVALTASPAHVALAGSGRSTVRVTNAGASRVVVDVSRAGFALDLRGRPRIVRRREAVARSAADWLTFRPRSLVLKPGGAAMVGITSKLPSRAEPGDHDALLLFTTRRRVRDGVAVRMRMGVVVVVRAPGAVIRRLELRDLRVSPRGRLRVLELGLTNRGNVTESLTRARSILSLFREGRRVAKLYGVPREVRPRTRGVLQFVYRGRARGAATARVDIAPESSSRVLRRSFRVRL